MATDNQALKDDIQKILTKHDWEKFNDILARNAVPGDDLAEDIIWQALYQTNKTDFYNTVLPPLDKSIIGRMLRPKYKKKDIYKSADKIIAASSAFTTESDLENMERAWDMVARAEAMVGADTLIYKDGAEKVFANILRTRPAELQILGTLYADPDIARRNKRIKKYLFTPANSKANAKVLEKLNKKLTKLDAERSATVKEKIAAAKSTLVKNVRGNTPVKTTGFFKKTKAKAINEVANSIIGYAVQSPEIQQQQQEADTMLPEDVQYIHAVDELFGLDSITIQFGPLPTGFPLDVNKIFPEQLTLGNILATVKQEAMNKANQHIHSSDIADKGKRGARIIGATAAVMIVLTGIGIVAVFPPALPFVIAAAVTLLGAIASFFYFNRDPIPKLAKSSESLFSRILSAITDVFKPKPTLNPQLFSMPDATRQFLQKLDPQMASQLEAHFKQRAAEIGTTLKTAIATNDTAASDNIEKDLDQLTADWQKIITAANSAASNNDTEELRIIAKDYLKNSYQTIARPHFIELAKERKQQWDAKRERKTLTFSPEKNKIDELTKLVEQVNHISTSKIRT